MADKYSNVISFYCFATKLIGVTEKVNSTMINDNIWSSVHLSHQLVLFFTKKKNVARAPNST